ncbi:hypothetical protein PFISCL1PPCAC_12650 [Pristionchus fissidentatus]|uniref:SGF29 C-terminal domain-containing protein n=1 Tax=Pristionchus fissidentatus TaxID=1538716 RepID=A0AAV5VSM6_9BILA|nr:hypothetical protein PFISCL1PPCAC_12650 [Pristionchus fissidentatus]
MVRKGGEVSLEERQSKATEDFNRKLRSVPARKDRVNESLAGLQEFADSGGTLFQSRNRGRATSLNQQLHKNCSEEAEYLRKLLSDIEKLKELDLKARTQMPMSRQQLMQCLGQQGESLPLWIGGVDGFPPPSVGAVEQPASAPLKTGDAVAALVDENWILAEVQAALPGGKFEVKDVDDEQKTQLVLSRNCLIPLPKYRADPLRDGHAIFPRDAIVLALYPQTTCFYRGIIHKTPEIATEQYSITFEDSSYNTGYSPALPIHQRYVVSYRDPPDIRHR